MKFASQSAHRFKFKLSTEIVATTVLVSSVIAMANGETAAQIPSGQIITKPVLADATAPDTTQPSDQSTPVDTLKKLSAAVQADDPDSIADCLCDDGVDPDAAATARRFFLFQAAVWRLKNAWQTKFNEPMNPPNLNFDDFPGHGTFETLLAQILDFPGGLQATIDEDTAQVRIPLPREAFISPGKQQITALGHWSGAMLVFKRIGGDWKLDTDRTFNFVVQLGRQTGNTKSDLVIEHLIYSELSDTIETAAADIESGTLATRQSAINRLQAAARRTYKDAHIDWDDDMILPVIGG